MSLVHLCLHSHLDLYAVAANTAGYADSHRSRKAGLSRMSPKISRVLASICGDFSRANDPHRALTCQDAFISRGRGRPSPPEYELFVVLRPSQRWPGVVRATVLTPSTNLVRKSTLALLNIPSLSDTTMNCDFLKCVRSLPASINTTHED